MIPNRAAFGPSRARVSTTLRAVENTAGGIPSGASGRDPRVRMGTSALAFRSPLLLLDAFQCEFRELDPG